jgi:GlpG protein
MRELTTLDTEQQAQRLAAGLTAQGIPSSVDFETDQWVVWIENDDDRDTAAEVLSRFQANPDAAEFVDAIRKVESIRRAQQEQAEQQQRAAQRLKKRWSGSWWHSYPATQVITIACIVVVLITTDWSAGEPGFLGLPNTCNRSDSAVLDALYMQEIIEETRFDGSTVRGWPRESLLDLLQSGQLWRFVTPVFLHFGVLHILFNLMWLRVVGMATEFVLGTRKFIALFVTLAVISNSAQFVWDGPNFGGMSGVVFGLIGYVWIKGRTQPQLGLGLSPDQFVYAVLWLVLCMGGAFGNIANAAHLGGFVTGIVIGARPALVTRIRAAMAGNSNDGS